METGVVVSNKARELHKLSDPRKDFGEIFSSICYNRKTRVVEDIQQSGYLPTYMPEAFTS